MRATLRLSSPAWLAQPRNTSSTASAIAPLRATSCLIAVAARSSVRTRASAPSKRPIGVRTKSQMNASGMQRVLQQAGEIAPRALGLRLVVDGLAVAYGMSFTHQPCRQPSYTSIFAGRPAASNAS